MSDPGYMGGGAIAPPVTLIAPAGTVALTVQGELSNGSNIQEWRKGSDGSLIAKMVGIGGAAPLQFTLAGGASGSFGTQISIAFSGSSGGYVVGGSDFATAGMAVNTAAWAYAMTGRAGAIGVTPLGLKLAASQSAPAMTVLNSAPATIFSINIDGAVFPGSGSGGITGGIRFCTGVPSNAIGTDGDVMLRQDGGVGTLLYQRRAGAYVAVI